MQKLNREDILSIICDTVHKTEPSAHVILYGSRARGDARKDSDWDVVVLIDKPKMSHSDRYEIACDLWEEGLAVGEEINTFVYTMQQWESAPPSMFKHNVLNEGIRL